MNAPKDPLKVLCIAGWYPNRKNPYEGIFIREHVYAIAKQHDVVVLYRDFNSSDSPLSDSVENGIRTIRFFAPAWMPKKLSYFLFTFKIASIVQNKLISQGWHPDLIHAHEYIAMLPALRLQKKLRIPAVSTEHSSTFPRHELSFFEQLIARYGLRRAAMILPVSSVVEQGLRDYGIKTGCTIIPNVVDTAIFNPSRQPQKNIKKKILVVASLIPVKGIDYLINAVAQLVKKRQDFVLEIVGDGTCAKAYKQLTEQLKLNNFIRFHGRQNKTIVSGFMKGCDFFVQPSLFETFGVTLIEAMACGKPIVASNAGGISCLITEDIGLLVTPKNSIALQHAINTMLDSFHHYSALDIARHARENFSYEVVGKKISELYKKVLAIHT
ncbi:MAG: glycosyltransferase [Patescibacteria group bacterium]